jgi:hypothetical protein
VAEHLEEGPLGVEQLANRQSVDSAMLYRLLRVGVAMDLLDYDNESQTFSTTPMLRVLHEDAPESLKHYAQALTGPAFWLTAERTPQAIAVGKNQSVDVLGRRRRSRWILRLRLVERSPELAGAVLDLEHVIPGVAEEAQRRGLAQRVHGIAGNCFKPLPAADVYLLKFTLHDIARKRPPSNESRSPTVYRRDGR